MTDEELIQIREELRREADAKPFDMSELVSGDVGVFVSKAAEAPHRYLYLDGHAVRAMYSRDKSGSLEFYHLSLGGPTIRQLPKETVGRVLDVLLPGERRLQIPSIMGNTLQWIQPIEKPE